MVIHRLGDRVDLVLYRKSGTRIMVAMMKNWQFYSLQSSIMIVASLASTSVIAKGIFMILAIGYLVMQFGAITKP